MSTRSTPPVILALLFGFLGGITASFVVFALNKIPEDVLAKGHPLISAPFLAFISVAVFVALFYGPLHGLLTKGHFTIKWGDKEINISEIESNVDLQFQELESKLADVDAEVRDLKQRFCAEEKHAEGVSSIPPESSTIGEIKATFPWVKSDAVASLVYHLGSSRYKWRNLDTLCKNTGLTPSEIDAVVVSVPEHIKRSKAKSGNVIYRLSDEAKGGFIQLRLKKGTLG